MNRLLVFILGATLAIASRWAWDRWYWEPKEALRFQTELHQSVEGAVDAVYEAGRRKGRAEAKDEFDRAKVLAAQALELTDEVKRVLEDTLWAAQCDAAMAAKLKLEGGGE